MNNREMLAYSTRVRSKFAEKIFELPKETVEKNNEASFYSMKNILLHIIDNENWIVNYAIFERTKEYKRRKWEEYTTMEIVLDHVRDVERKTREYLERVDENELRRFVKFELSSGKTYDLPVEECLFQSFTEQLFHLGELIGFMWQGDIEPPTMQWLNNNPRTRNQSST